MNTTLVKSMLIRTLFLLLVSISFNSFAQNVVYYSDTLAFEQRIKPEEYYAVEGKFEELVESPRFQDVTWFVDQLKNVKAAKRLNDYFTYEVLKEYTEVFFTKRDSHKYQAAFVYAVLCELGFDLKVVFSSGKYCMYTAHMMSMIRLYLIYGVKSILKYTLP